MSTHRRRLARATGAVAIGICMLGANAWAQQATSLTGSAPAYMSGGVGLEARTALAQNEKNANLKLVFTEPQGSYLANIQVTVTDRQGAVVFDTQTEGPWLLARLAPGTYKVVAKDGSVVHQRTVSVGTGLRTEHFRMTEQAGIPGRPPSS